MTETRQENNSQNLNEKLVSGDGSNRLLEVEEPKNPICEPNGFGGWLLLFQLYMFAWITKLGMPMCGFTIYGRFTEIVIITSKVVVMTSFYIKLKSFRWINLVVALLSLTYMIVFLAIPEIQYLIKYPEDIFIDPLYLILLVYIAVEFFWAIYFFKSERAKNTFVEKKESNPQFKKSTSKNLVGIGGWLILFQIYLFAYALLVLLNIRTEYELLASLLWIVPTTAVIILFYKKNMRFRLIYIILAILKVFALILLPICGLGYANLFDYAYIMLLVEASIIIALFKSKRVENTFF